MDIEAIKKMLGLPPEATEDQVMTAIKAGAQAVEELATERTKAEASEQTVAAANQDCEAAKADAQDARDKLENERRAHEATKAELANERRKFQKLEALKTKSVTTGLAKERVGAGEDDSDRRMQLVNEFQSKGMCYLDAWAAAKRRNPDLFK